MGNLDLRFYVWLLIRRSPIIILLTAIGGAIGVIVALSLPPTYHAVAKILVEQQRISNDLARTYVPVNAIEQLQIIEQQLKTRASMLAMAEELGVYEGLPPAPPDDIVEDMRNRTQLMPLQFDTPRGYGGALAFAIIFGAQDPDLAAKVANAYADTILETNRRVRQERALDALTFTRAEVDRLAGKLAEAGDEIAKFKAKNQDALPDSLEYRRTLEDSLQDRLEELRREADQLRNRRETLTKVYAEAGETSPGVTTPEDALLDDLRRRLVEQRAMFAEDSPNIVALQKRIEALEKVARDRRERMISGAEPAQMPAELQLQFADIDSRLAAIGNERSSIEARLGELAQSISATAVNATALERLERDYDNTQSQYNAAAARLADASAGARIEQQAIGEKLTLIEPAVPPANPSSSKRKIVAIGGAAGGFALALGLILAFEFWRAAIYRPSDIGKVFDGEPIGVIPYIPRRAVFGRTRMKAPAAAAAAVALLALLGLTAVLIMPDRSNAGDGSERPFSLDLKRDTRGS